MKAVKGFIKFFYHFARKQFYVYGAKDVITIKEGVLNTFLALSKEKGVKYFFTFDKGSFEVLLIKSFNNAIWSALNSYKLVILKNGKIFKKSNDLYDLSFRKSKGFIVLSYHKNRLAVFTKNANIYIHCLYEFKNLETLNEFLEVEQELYRRLGLKWTLSLNTLYSIAGRVGLLLQRMRIKEYFKEGFEDKYKKLVKGGRVEIKEKGFYKDIYHYDIRSAYLSATRELLDIQSIQAYEGYKEGTGYYFIEWNLKGIKDFYYFPARFNNVLIYSKAGKGWITSYELEVYKRYLGMQGIKVKKSLLIESNNKKVFEELANILYDLRKQYKNIEDVLKKYGNAIYGKLLSKYSNMHNWFAGGLVIGYIRSKILDVLINHNEDIIYIFIDGFFTKRKIDVNLNEELGAFKETAIKECYIAGAGWYYYIDKEGKETLKTMGSNTAGVNDIKQGINARYIKTKINNKSLFYNHNVELLIDTYLRNRVWINNTSIPFLNLYLDEKVQIFVYKLLTFLNKLLYNIIEVLNARRKFSANFGRKFKYTYSIFKQFNDKS